MAQVTQWYIPVSFDDGGGAVYKVTVNDSDTRLGSENRPMQVAELFEASGKMDSLGNVMGVFPVHSENFVPRADGQLWEVTL